MLGQHLFTAAMTIGPDREGLFNEVYETEHMPALLQVPGVLSISRYRRVVPVDSFYLAVYEIASPEVPSSASWATGRDIGRWPTEVRPFTRGLVNGLYSRRAGFAGDASAGVGSAGLLFARVLQSVAAQPGLEGILDVTLESLSACRGVTAGAHYVDVADGSHVLVAGLQSPEVTGGSGSAMEVVAPIADAELYAAI